LRKLGDDLGDCIPQLGLADLLRQPFLAPLDLELDLGNLILRPISRRQPSRSTGRSRPPSSA